MTTTQEEKKNSNSDRVPKSFGNGKDQELQRVNLSGRERERQREGEREHHGSSQESFGRRIDRNQTPRETEIPRPHASRASHCATKGEVRLHCETLALTVGSILVLHLPPLQDRPGPKEVDSHKCGAQHCGILRHS
jgi:hypothetical protein